MTQVTADMPRTEWFEPDIKPVYAGWYETYYKCLSRFPINRRFWNGEQWCLDFGAGTWIECANQNRHWRGLVSDPKWRAIEPSKDLLSGRAFSYD